MTSALGRKEVKQRSLCFCTCINLFQDLPAERALVRIRENELQEAHNHPQSKHEWSALFETQVFNPLDPDGDADYQAIMFFPNKCCQVQCDAHDPQDFNGFQCGIIFKDDVFLFWFLCHLSGRWKVFHLAGKPLCLQDKTQKSEGWYWMGIGKYCLCLPKDQCFLCRHLNIFELAFMDNSGNVTWPFHTCQSLSLLRDALKAYRITVLSFPAQSLSRKTADKNPRRKIQHQVPHMQNACSAWKSRNLSKIWLDFA